MERPIARPRIGGRFEPTTRRQDVVALVAIHIARTNPMSVATVADDVRHPRLVLDFVPRLARAVLLRQHFLGLTVVVDVGEHREFNVEAFVDGLDLPHLVFPCHRSLAWIAPPRYALGEPRDRDDVRKVVGVDVDDQIAEVVDVLIAESELPKAVLRPFGCLIPVLARNDVEPPVAVDVGDRSRLARAIVDSMNTERNIGWAAALRESNYSDGQQKSAHGH